MKRRSTPVPSLPPFSLSLFPPPSGIINETQSYNEMRSSAGITNDVPLNRKGALSPSKGGRGVRGKIYTASPNSWGLLMSF